jgi:hypothetical protein
MLIIIRLYRLSYKIIFTKILIFQQLFSRNTRNIKTVARVTSFPATSRSSKLNLTIKSYAKNTKV